jgi:outer membrane protein assembly factor BamE (lipoprotein component of BamABCDE complex)
MNRYLVLMSSALAASLTMTGCKSIADQTQGLAATDHNLAVGGVQSQIRLGMTQTEVSSVLGSPSIVSRDQGNKEAWIYDKIATKAHYSSSEDGAGIEAGAGGVSGKTLILGGVGSNYSKSTGVRSTTQKTLTVIIKFDQAQRVEGFNYHSSKL